MVPDLKCCIAFEFGEDTVGGADAVVGCLENGGDCFGDAKREDEKICSLVKRYDIEFTSGVQIQSGIKIGYRRSFDVEPFLNWSHVFACPTQPQLTPFVLDDR